MDVHSKTKRSGHGGAVLLALAALTVPALAYADRGVSFCEYRYLAPLKQIRLTRGSIHLPGPVTLEALNDPALEEAGIFSLEPHPMRTYKRSVSIDGNRVDLEIGAFPPTGRGIGGAVATSSVRVSINGIKVVDAPLDSMMAQINVLSIMPLDGMIIVNGSYDGKAVEAVLFLGSNGVVTEEWLAQRAGK